MTCDAPPIEFPECGLDLSTTACDLELFDAARTLLEAARCIADATVHECLYKCSEGQWKHGVTNSTDGVVVGTPGSVCETCCGSLTVGTLLDTTPDNFSDCWLPKNSQLDLKISWPCGTADWIVASERSRFLRLLPEVFCCKQDVGPKDKKLTISLLGVDNSPADDCDNSVLYTYRVN